MERAARTGAAMGQQTPVRSALALEGRGLGTPEAAVIRGDHNTRPAAVVKPDSGDLTAPVFRALYRAYDLHLMQGVHVVVPRGTPCFAGPSLGDVARQISDHEQRRVGRAQ
jgi:hypothetical protein